MPIRAALRLALAGLAASTLAACSTAESYLDSINPFRRQDEAARRSANPPPTTSEPAQGPPAERPR